MVMGCDRIWKQQLPCKESIFCKVFKELRKTRGLIKMPLASWVLVLGEIAGHRAAETGGCQAMCLARGHLV